MDCLASPKLNEQALTDLSRQIFDFIQAKEGQIVSNSSPRRLPLAYPIQKESVAVFQTVDFRLEKENLAELEKKLKDANGLLRFLLIRKKPARLRPLKSRARKFAEKAKETPVTQPPKVELQEIEKKLEEILGDES